MKKTPRKTAKRSNRTVDQNAQKNPKRPALSPPVKPNPNGCILYRGPSRFDTDVELVVILTGLTDDSDNGKTGVMLQTWILLVATKPTIARKTGQDIAICLDCPHKVGSCYVNLGQGPRAVWQCFYDGNGYADFDETVHGPQIAGRNVRIGSYGDPAAVSIEVFRPVLRLARRHTGYTHQWETPLGAEYRETCMASCDTDRQATAAADSGWRYFLASLSHTGEKGEVSCPAARSEDSDVVCDKCTLCNGGGNRKPHVFINVHGNKAMLSIYKNKTLPAIADRELRSAI
jgi:hypothetical protein